jgi:putative adenylate-forming enzyme
MSKIVAVKNFIEVRWLRRFNKHEKLVKYQNKMLKKQLSFIKENSNYYKNIDINDFESIPIINKKIMMDNFNKINTVGLERDVALEIAINSEHTRDFETKYNNISVGLSSGTSGHRGLFVVSDKESMEWAGAVLAKLLPKKDLLNHKIAFFLRADNNLYESINSSVIKFEFFDLLNSMDDNLKKLNEYDPTILVAPASVLKTIAKAVLKGEIRINPKKIISVAEVLNESDERFIKKVFKKKIIFQVYQCTEGFLGYTCECGNLHLNEDIVYIEKEYIEKNRFIPIITDFRRKSQPVIRYRLNDVLIESNKKCNCGNPSLIIKKIEGREDDIFVFNGESEDVLVYPDFISRCLVYVDDISEYRVVQLDKNNIKIYIDKVNNDIKKNIIKEFKLLSKNKKFKLPNIEFVKYEKDGNKKVKRVERKFVYEKD